MKPKTKNTKKKTCQNCKCADNKMCFHYAFMGKSGKPTLCKIAVMNCPGYMEKTNQ